MNELQNQKILEKTVPKYIAQGLLRKWKENSCIDAQTNHLEQYMRNVYKDRYVPMCYYIGVTPISFSKWLFLPINLCAKI